MKYTVTAWIEEDHKYETEISVRRDASLNTVFQKCMNAIGARLADEKILTTGKYQYSKPSRYNGCVGAAWFCDPFINVTIQEENGAWLAM